MFANGRLRLALRISSPHGRITQENRTGYQSPSSRFGNRGDEDGAGHDAHITAARIEAVNAAEIVEGANLCKSVIETEAGRMDARIPGFRLASSGRGAVDTVVPDPMDGIARVDRGIQMEMVCRAEVNVEHVKIHGELRVGEAGHHWKALVMRR